MQISSIPHSLPASHEHLVIVLSDNLPDSGNVLEIIANLELTQYPAQAQRIDERMVAPLAAKRRHGMRGIPHQENTAGWQGLELEIAPDVEIN